MWPDGEPAGVGEAFRSPAAIGYQPRYREAMCLAVPLDLLALANQVIE